MRKDNDSTSGAIIIETSIVLPLFMIMTLFIYGLFSITSSQNQMTHVLIQSSKSLSLDPYLIEHVDSVAEADTFWNGLGSMILDFARVSNDKHFSSAHNWYDGTGDASLVKDRFVGFLSGGDEDKANEKLKSLGIVDGLDGLLFEMKISDKDMTITIKYEIQFLFDLFDLGKIPMEQSITVKMWK